MARERVPRFTTKDGVRLHYVDAGRGTPLVFIHGWMMSGRFFHRQVEDLSRDRRTIALDLRGCGDSEAKAGSHTLDRLADDVHELVEHQGLEGVTLVGWSMGGGITMRYLDRHGTQRLAGVCLVDFPPKYEEGPQIAAKVCARLETDRDAFFAPFIKRMFEAAPSPADLDWIMAENRKCATATGCEMYRQLGVGNAVGKRYGLPALLVFPKRGWFTPSIDAWKGIFPRHQLPLFEHSRHCPFLEEATAFNDALRSFTR